MIRRALDLERLKRLQSTKRRAGSARWAAMGDGRWRARQHGRGNNILIGYARPLAASPSAALARHPARAAKAWHTGQPPETLTGQIGSHSLQAHPQLLHLCRAAAGREKLDAELLPRCQPAWHHNAVIRAVRRRHSHKVAAVDALRHGYGKASGDRADRAR
jgi:hypothetical protein